ncbi:hypothetical protein BDU57DRAFT_550842 [Ampelomyces quisqualis]|uniref:Peptidase C15, pyroglutamyl peptidase I-like protein n=1 Tax=Ampelomyces quisqualis TaxID=50730 RepID=A0A6A5QE88_AMPQU|nr:hypothetical protein BDU57DRAFT_550842 [Ampelomyces quisqualis]
MSDEDIRFLDVGVTAFGLYASDYEFNASNLVLAALPDIIPLPGGRTHLRILKYPEISVTFESVSAAVTEIWNTPSAKWATNLAELNSENTECRKPWKTLCQPDIVLHIGQMRSFAGYSFEKLANRDGYVRKDLDNKIPETSPHPQEKGKWVERKFASNDEILYPAIDIDEVAAKVKAALPDALIRASIDAGRFVCEYTFYSSLAELEIRGQKTKQALFLHVPAKASPEDIKRGVTVVKAYLAAVLGEL